MPDFMLESAHPGLVAGVDEVGRGPLAGPVVAAAVVFLKHPDAVYAATLDDSKKLSATRRQAAYERLIADPDVAFGISAASVEEIGRYNILHASHLAMRRAVARLPVAPSLVLVDGNMLPGVLPCAAQAVIGGDRRSLSIAGASIIAKIVRDRLMTRLARRYRAYAWERNAGYGTKAHLQGLREHGASHHHRRDFAPVRACLQAKTERAA